MLIKHNFTPTTKLLQYVLTSTIINYTSYLLDFTLFFRYLSKYSLYLLYLHSFSRPKFCTRFILQPSPLYRAVSHRSSNIKLDTFRTLFFSISWLLLSLTNARSAYFIFLASRLSTSLLLTHLCFLLGFLN